MPKLTPTQLRAYVYRHDPCLAHIVDHEDGTWVATRYGAGGSYGSAAGAARVEDGVGRGGLADESVDAAAVDEGLCERPLRVVVRRVVVLAVAPLVLAEVAA